MTNEMTRKNFCWRKKLYKFISFAPTGMNNKFCSLTLACCHEGSFLRNISRHVCISSSAEILLQVSHNRFIIPPLLFDVYRHIHGWSLETWKLCGMRIYVRGFPCNLPERETKWKAIFILLFFLFVHASFLWFSLKMKLFFRRI